MKQQNENEYYDTYEDEANEEGFKSLIRGDYYKSLAKVLFALILIAFMLILLWYFPSNAIPHDIDIRKGLM